MKAVITLVACLCLLQSYGQGDLRKKHFNIKKGIAIEGYDPVRYFKGKPEEGDEELTSSYKGITYCFVSPSNLAKFNAAPDRYEPAYGGWCAYAMGEKGEKVKIDPETFKILDGRLYPFYNLLGQQYTRRLECQ